MSIRRFYPIQEADQIPWLYNYKAKIPTHGPTCGISTTELASTAYDLANLIWLLEVWTPAIRQDAKEATAYKNLMFTGSGPTVALPVATVFATPPTLLVAGAPEMREYRLRFWDQGEVNGDWSPVQKVTVGV